MERAEVEARLNGLIDALAPVEHERWAHWQKYMHRERESNRACGRKVPQPLN